MSSILDYIDQGDPSGLLILDKELAVGSFGTVYAVSFSLIYLQHLF
jgi:hypothetical protein